MADGVLIAFYNVKHMNDFDSEGVPICRYVGECRESTRPVDIYRDVPSLDGVPQIAGHAQIQVATTRKHTSMRTHA